MKTVASHFETFSKALRLDEAPAGQKRDMKLAFYGGATCMLGLMTMMATESGDNDDVGATRIAALHREMRDFARNLKGGS